MEIGDLVYLKSGGPVMKIIGIREEEDKTFEIQCEWFVIDGKLTASFPQDALMAYQYPLPEKATDRTMRFRYPSIDWK